MHRRGTISNPRLRAHTANSLQNKNLPVLESPRFEQRQESCRFLLLDRDVQGTLQTRCSL